MITVRPHNIFELLDNKKNHYCNMLLPILNKGGGGITFLESSIIVSVLELTNPSRIFEFGTFLGATTVMFAMNSKAHVTTLDIPTEGIEIQVEKEDDSLRDISKSMSGIYIDRVAKEFKDKITRIYFDSTKFNIKDNGYEQKFDLVFIDGGHNYEMVKNDTQKTLQLLKKGGTIIWHDYNSAKQPDVKRFVDEYAESTNSDSLFHIGNTMLAIQNKTIGKLLVKMI